MAKLKTARYKDLKGLEDARTMSKLQAIVDNKGRNDFSITENIPGTVPEKMIYDYLTRLKVNFDFQYHLPENYGTQNVESVWIPDFMLPDYNNSIIEVYGTYWHMLRRGADQVKKAYWLAAGYTVIEKGIPMFPSKKNNGGKVIIWWENEIYTSIGQLFSRDLPELYNNHMHGKSGVYNLDPIKEFNRIMAMRKRLSAQRVRPKYVSPVSRIRKFKTKSNG